MARSKWRQNTLRVDVIKNVEVIIYKWKSYIMSLLGHDVIYIQVKWYRGLFLPASFFYCFETLLIIKLCSLKVDCKQNQDTEVN